MPNNEAIDGFAGDFLVTQGYGNHTGEPPPSFPPEPKDSLLGDDAGGLTTDAENPSLDTDPS